MSNDQENFLAYQKNPICTIQNIDEFYKIINFFKYFLNGTHEPNQDFLNFFLYQCQYQLQNQLYQNNGVKDQPELPFFNLNISKIQADKTGMLQESIEKILSSNENKPTLKNLSKSEFTSNEIYKQNFKQSNHKRSVSSTSESMPIHKMVRGQEEWVNNSKNNNFISQILKCLECSASFDTLNDLSLHMLKFNHFSRFYPTQSSHHHRPVSPKLKNKATHSFGKLHKISPSPSNVDISRIKNSLSPKASDSRNFSCKICKKNPHEQSLLPPLIELIQHLKKDHQIDFICTNCGEFFYSEKDLNEHLVEFHQFGNVPQKKAKFENEKKETKSVTSISSPVNSKEKLNDPLLALQMFVNGSSELDSLSESKAKSHNPDINSEKCLQKSELRSKLPAKKRPYFKKEENSEENEIGEPKRFKNEDNTRESCNDMHRNSDQKSNTYQPLNLLQNMRLNIDDYFTR